MISNDMTQFIPIVILLMLGLPALAVKLERNKPGMAQLPFIACVLGCVVVVVLLKGVAEIKTMMLPASAGLALTTYFLIAVTVRRLNDARWNPWLAYILVVPIVSLAFLLALFIAPHKRDGVGSDRNTEKATPVRAQRTDKEALILKPNMEIKKNHSSEPPQAEGKEETTQSSEMTDQSKEFQILYEYDPIVKEYHDELEGLDPLLSRQFRDEVVSDRKKATDIRDRLKAGYEKKLKPYTSEELNEALAKARALGPFAEEEFIRVIEVMGEDFDVDDAIQRLSEKFISDITFVTEYKSFRIYIDSMGKYVVYSPTNVKVSSSLDYDSIDAAKAFIDR